MSLWKSVQIFAASFFKERAAALTSKAGLGQLWVKSDTPCTLQFTDDAGTDIALGSSNVEDSTAAGQLVFGDATGGYDHTETSEAIWDDTNKRVGLGIAAPTRDLTIKTSQDDGGISLFDNATGNEFIRLYKNGSGDTGRLLLFDGGGGRVHFHGNGNSYIFGNLGINTYSADRDVEIVDASNPQLRLSQTNASVYTDFQTDASGNMLIDSPVKAKLSEIITVSTATYGLNESLNHPEVILHVTRTATGTCVITIDTDMLSQDSQITIKDAGGGAATYNITIQTEGAETIDGASTKPISGNYDSLTLYNDNTNWFIK